MAKDPANRRYLGKFKVIQTKNGPMYKIYMDNLEQNKPDGTPNQYFSGVIIWSKYPIFIHNLNLSFLLELIHSYLKVYLF